MDADKEVFEKILAILWGYNGIDFSNYKESTLMRRIERRMKITGQTVLEEYLELLLHSEEEKAAFYEEAFIGVTNFFRDTQAYKVLYEQALPGLFDVGEDEIRVWSVGCANGAEAYSLAILLNEYKEKTGAKKSYRVLATDIDKKAVMHAQTGIFSTEELKVMTESMRDKYFTKEPNGYRILEEIRKKIIFSVHNIINDAPFSRIGMISCRNLFIYLKPHVQKRLLLLFYRQLDPRGCLFMGSSESLGEMAYLFNPVHESWRIFQKNPGMVSRAELEFGKMGGNGRYSIQPYEKYENLASSNEELQSTNEELQAVNEELHSLNSDYQNRIEELRKAYDDFDNLLKNSDVGALYIDNNFCIRKLTPILENNSYLLQSDVGRSIHHVKFMEGYPEFLEDVAYTMQTKEVVEKEVVSRHQITWLVRMRPYVRRDGETEGVLVILFDITKHLEAAKFELKMLNNNIPGGVARIRYQNGLVVEYANEGLYRLMNMSREIFALKHDNHYEECIYPQDWIGLKEKIEAAIHTNEPFEAEYRVLIEGQSLEWRMMQAKLIEQKSMPILQCIITDVTELKNVQANLDSLIENIPGGIIRLSYRNGAVDILYTSSYIFTMLGYTREEFTELAHTGKIDKLYMLSGDKEEVQRKLGLTVETGKVQNSQLRVRRKDGSRLWVELRGSVVSKNREETIVQYVVLDISEQKKNLYLVEQERTIFNLVAEMSADLIFEYNIQKDRMIYHNQNEDLANGTANLVENYSKIAMSLERAHPEDSRKLAQFIREIREGRPVISIRMRKKYKDGSYQWTRVEGRTIRDEDKVPLRVVGKVSNIQQIVQKEEELKKRTRCDSLTGLYNNFTIKQEIGRRLYEMSPADTGYLLVIDLDEFKHINDTMGHLFGDAVLCNFSEEIRNVFKDGLFGRLGGDEFLIFLENVKTEELEDGVSRLNLKLEKMYSRDGGNLKISCTAGAAECCGEEMFETILKRADHALYHGKSSHKGTLSYYSHSAEVIKGDNFKYLDKFTQGEKTKVLFIENDNDLVLFCLEILEKVSDIRSGIQVVADRICRYFSLSDIIFCIPLPDGRLEIRYHWNRNDAGHFVNWVLETTEPEWDFLLDEDKGVFVLRDKDIQNKTKALAKSMLSVHVIQGGMKGYVMYVDREADREFASEKDTMERLSNILFGRFRQLQEQEESRIELENLMNYDELTGLYKYQQFLEQSEQILKAHPDRKYVLIYSDFSNFQYLNEVYGYACGDEVLRKFAEKVKKTFGKDALFARINSDHFVSLHECEEVETLRCRYVEAGQEFCDEMNQEYKQCNLCVVGGMSEIYYGQQSVSNCVDSANTARKYIKNIAETNCAIFEDKMKKLSEMQMVITANMRRALQEEEFLVYYQPKFDLKTESLMGAEALVRWKMAGGKIVFPDHFIPVLEKNGFIKKVDFYVLEQALKMQKLLLEKGKTPVPISVNFSKQHQEDDNFIHKVVEKIQELQVPPGLIEAEVTESVVTFDLQKLNGNIKALKSNKIQVSLDDFGSAYSSLNVLTQVEADIIKLDKQFMGDVRQNSKQAEFIKYLIQMLKNMGFRVIAEGVETREQVDILVQAECDYAQGYYYEKPISQQAFLEKYFDITPV